MIDQRQLLVEPERGRVRITLRKNWHNLLSPLRKRKERKLADNNFDGGGYAIGECEPENGMGVRPVLRERGGKGRFADTCHSA
ncbi:MAG TPA: hypothetical protein VF313_03540 [Anaerolineaceae bacterium]